ncbi:MAG TPA: ParB/RepB/Spo0J family partition protein [Gammaproteobacteria bacterium]|jgi:ParB family chromosome partitioning protein|nr:ParB/RepB/Spo0J family partition protein [Gammaproteobacteria bacterium]
MAKKKVFSIGSALSQGLEETIESAQNYSSELRIDVIPIRKIELDPANPRDLALTMTDIQAGIPENDNEKIRKRNELDSLQSIAQSIKTQGIINPIMVYKHGEKYRLIAGERRTLASLLVGKTDIQAKILDDKPDALKISLFQWIENIERSDLSLWERLNNLEKIIGAYAQSKGLQINQVTITELSSLIGCVKSHAMNYKAILDADSELKQLIFENKIKNLEKAALIADIQLTEIKQQAVAACIAGATLKQLKQIAEQNKQNRVSIKSSERRGRQTTSVHFGGTKNINVAKVIIESLLRNSRLAQTAVPVKQVDWKNHRAVSETFKQLLKTLEKLHA